MPLWLTPTLLWETAGQLTMLAAFALFIWAMWSDRSRGRRRCPKCWYDMSAATSRRCPECGHDARTDRRLFKTRRHWRWAAVACIGMLAGVTGYFMPMTSNGTWPRAVPTTLLIAGRPWLEKPFTPNPDWRDMLRRELFDRCNASKLSDWQWNWLVRSALAETSSKASDPKFDAAYGSVPNAYLFQLASASRRLSADQQLQLDTLSRADFSCPEKWPAGEPLFGKFHFQTWRSAPVRCTILAPLGEELARQEYGGILSHSVRYPWRDGNEKLADAMPFSQPVAVKVSIENSAGNFPRDSKGWSLVREYSQTLPTKIEGSVSDFVKGKPSQLVMAALSTAKAQAATYDDWKNALVELDAKAAVTQLSVEGIDTLALKFEIVESGEVLASGIAWWNSGSLNYNGPDLFSYVTLRGKDAAQLHSAISSGKAALRLTGDAKTALRNFGQPTYWQGSVEVPLTLR